MKHKIKIIAIVLFFGLLAGCVGRGLSTSGSDSPSISHSSQEPSSESKSAEPEITDELKSMCDNQLYEMSVDQSLFISWDRTRPVQEERLYGAEPELTDITREGNTLTVTADIYACIYINPNNAWEESTDIIGPPIYSEDKTHYRKFLVGRSVVKMAETPGQPIPISCEFEKLPLAGIAYLKAQTEKLAPQLEASEKIDAAKYDAFLIDYLWSLLCTGRYIEKPEDITFYDLENLTGHFQFPYPNIYDENSPDIWAEGYRIDGSLLRHMPNLTSVDCPYLLADYSVFENMHKLKTLDLYSAGEEMFSTLKVGRVEVLALHDPDFDNLDLSNVNTEVLQLESWYSAVRGFSGCEKIKKLYFTATRTDMRLVNPETFPNVEYMNLYFYSDTPRVRNLSRLAEYGGDVKIDLYLDYQACNNETLKSLAGVKLNEVILDPENGAYMLPDLDRSLFETIDANSMKVGGEMYFRERTG